MHDNDNRGWMTPALAGAVLGPALQVQQEALWGWEGYAALLGTALVLLAFPRNFLSRWRVGAGARVLLVFSIATALAFAACGLRAVQFAASGLPPQLEGRDIGVTGVVAAMPQRNDTGLRFRLEVEDATAAGTPVRVPPQIYLGWYGGAVPDANGMLELQRVAPELHAGERWRMTVRLKAPHGNVNPHGFDYELWLWEQGLQATGYVRAGPRDPPPQRLDSTWRHPVERARQAVRDAVFEHVADRKTAGLLAALVVGDQNAIDLVNFSYCLLPAARPLQRQRLEACASSLIRSLLLRTGRKQLIRPGVSRLATPAMWRPTVDESSHRAGAFPRRNFWTGEGSVLVGIAEP